MKLYRYASRLGASLVETMVAGGVFMVISAATVTGVVSLQRNFTNTADYAGNHSSQLRISDYIARDLRQALSFSQVGTGAALVMTLTVPNYYAAGGGVRTPAVIADGSVVYQDTSVNPPKRTATIRYFISNGVMFREVDGVARSIAEDVADFVIIPLDSALAPSAATTFNLTGITSKVAEVKVQVNFKTRFGSKTVTQTFYNMTLMRNARTDAQTNLY